MLRPLLKRNYCLVKCKITQKTQKKRYLPVVVLLEDVDLLKGLKNLALDRAGGLDVVRWARATVDTATVNLSESTNTNALAKVDVASNRGYKTIEEKKRSVCHCNRIVLFVDIYLTSVDVEPIGVIGSKLLVGASLNNVDPLGDFELASALEVSGIGLNELYKREKKSTLGSMLCNNVMQTGLPLKCVRIQFAEVF